MTNFLLQDVFKHVKQFKAFEICDSVENSGKRKRTSIIIPNERILANKSYNKSMIVVAGQDKKASECVQEVLQALEYYNSCIEKLPDYYLNIRSDLEAVYNKTENKLDYYTITYTIKVKPRGNTCRK